MATNTPIFIIVTNHADDSIPVSALVANFMKKAMVKDLVKELAKKLAKEQAKICLTGVTIGHIRHCIQMFWK